MCDQHVTREVLIQRVNIVGGGVNPFQHLPGLGVCDQRVNTGLTLTHQPCCVAVIKVRMFV